MFGTLTDKLRGVVSRIAGKKTLTEENIAEAVREVRLALLEADVHFGVTKMLVKRVKERAVGQEVIRSVDPGQQFVKVIHDELAALMGEGEAKLQLGGSPSVILMCGLQGSGKTTTSAKLAHHLKKQGKRPLLAACDLQRPAAVEQLKILGAQIDVPVFSIEGEKRPLVVAKKALKEPCDVLIVDTAGRLHVDEPLMDELASLKKALGPSDVLFVANATTGQDAVNSAKVVHERVGITGSVLTMLDGSTRGGAAISIREVTGAPLVFEGIGEKIDDLQLFNPHSMADRVLGMGDTINLVKAAEEHIDEEKSKALAKKMQKASFTFEDYLGMMGMVEKMGSMKKLLSMLPVGLPAGMLEGSTGEFQKIRAIISSMTPTERREECELMMQRRRRIARGSGTSIDDVNRLVKGFKQAKKMMKGSKGLKKKLGV
jgi:signal recognition particle subunit SRP54